LNAPLVGGGGYVWHLRTPEMQRAQTTCFGFLFSAGAQCEKARKVYEQMQSNGCQPDVVTYTALVSAYERGGQWLLALEAFDEMVARGCWPDAIVYNAIIDALWQTGVVWAQVRPRTC
jgi:pentatricopeptide repeat protein